MDPMTSSGQFNLLEVHFGINGQRLDAVEMQAREYSVALNDFYIVTELPIGGVGGYYEVTWLMTFNVWSMLLARFKYL